MESSRNKKRGVEENDISDSKRPKLASVVVEALKVDSLQRLCSSLEPLFRRIVSEEVERALSRFNQSELPERSIPTKIQPEGGRSLRLEFKTRIPPHLFTGGKVEGEQGAAIHIVLVDNSTGLVISDGPKSCLKLDVVVLEGDFSEEDGGDWTKEQFESHVVEARKGKRPLLTGDLQVALNEGIGTLAELSFTDNSSWIRSRKFRLGVKVAPELPYGFNVREGITEAFAVKDHRGELYKKHYPPALHDEVWRLERIAKDGALHTKLVRADIATVKDFLHLLMRDPQKLRNILGSAMSNKMWENTVEHAKTCVVGGKLYVYYSDESRSTAVVFDQIYELWGFLADGQFVSLESLNHAQKVSVDSLVKRAYENWSRVVEYDGKSLTAFSDTKNTAKTLPSPIMESPLPVQTLNHHLHNHHHPQQFETFHDTSSYLPVSTLEDSRYVPPDCSSETKNRPVLGDFFAEEIRVRSSEMLQNEDMQRLLRSFTMGGRVEDACYAEESCLSYEPYQTHRKGSSRVGSGKAVVGWLKLKAALRWGIFIRKQAAVRRAQLVELN